MADSTTGDKAITRETLILVAQRRPRTGYQAIIAYVIYHRCSKGPST